tara:strand:+ start:1717 stop:2769 length:1053 start_codon:yes stop_codon:yes gene_type:complete
VNLLITGGTGFIGSHTCLLLLERGYDLVIYDSFINSSQKVLGRLRNILNFNNDYFDKRVSVIKGDMRDKEKLRELFSSFQLKGKSIKGVLHLAGLKSITDSIINPLEYWDVNLSGTKNLLSSMIEFDCKTLLFSSSATIYGSTPIGKINEDHFINPINPYGKTKAAVENLLTDLYQSDDKWSIACLRYFNPVGAHSSGLIGEDPLGIPNNLFPLISNVAAGRIEKLKVFGSDWPTTDGTGIRDYIHVNDLAEGHCDAIKYLLERKKGHLLKLNLGSGRGHTVLEVISTFNKVIGSLIPYEIVDRRSGDNGISIADPSLAKNILGWEAKNSLFDMCRDSWNWQKNNPEGYY